MRRRKQFKQSLSLSPPKREFTYEKSPGLKSRGGGSLVVYLVEPIGIERQFVDGVLSVLFQISRYDKCKINVEDTLRRILTR